MTEREPGKKILVQAAIVVLCLTCSSCVSTDILKGQDYIGPTAAPAQPSPVKDQAPAAEPSSPMPGADGPLQIAVQDAILLALEHNRGLRVEKFNPAISKEAEETQRSAFDPVLSGSYSRLREKIDQDQRPVSERVSNEIDGNLAVLEHLPTGTDIAVGMSNQRSWSDLYSDDLYETRLGLSVTQALLKGAGLGYNLAALRQARLDTLASQYELRGFAEALVAGVEETYWDYALTQRQIEIFLESLKLAEQQKDEMQEMIRIGYLAESEVAAAEAEIALRREGLINARSNLEKTRLQLLRLLNPPGANLWQREIVLLLQPAIPEVTLDAVDSHVDVALRMRPDLNQARLQVQQGDLEIVKTKNGLLPKMDFFIDLGKTGYADSFGRSVRDMDGDSYDIATGLSVGFPLLNRDARAQYRSSLLSRSQAEEAVRNLGQLVEVDVRSAYIEVNRSREQIAATAATRVLQEEKARIEAEKFRVGKSTALMVAQAQRDLLQSRITEIQTIANYLKSLVELYRLEGSLLERRGIIAPGNEPVGN